MYDYGARFYDPQIGRFHAVDPLAEEAYSWTPFRYGFNNPLKFTDPTGMWEYGYTVDKDGNFERVDNTGVDENGENQYDVLYKKSDYDAGKREYDDKGKNGGIKIDDVSFIPEFKKDKPEAIQKDAFSDTQKHQGNYATIDSKNSLSVFTFLADNVPNEWSYLKTTDNVTVIGTLNTNSQGFSFSQLDQFSDLSKHALDIHSHPGVSFASFYVSGGDKACAETTRKYNKDAKFYVYIPELTKANYNKVFKDKYVTPPGRAAYKWPLLKTEPRTKFAEY